ncbi:MAG: hypothetical protein ABUL73_01145 [Alphaproteobacteria bacterium]
MATTERRSFWSRITPGLTLMVLATLVAETLPGATRPSVYLSFPPVFIAETAVWGGGALIARSLTRRWNLGWPSLLLLALALAVAEEFIIQQTSIAPMAIQLQHVEYARAFGVNYVYFVWAAIYESVFVVLLPVMLAELIFPTRHTSVWGSWLGLAIAAFFFVPGAVMAWYGWVKIARPMLHAAPYDPERPLLLGAVIAIVVLFFIAIGPFRRALAKPAKPMTPPAPFVLGLLGFVFAVLVEAFAVLAFGQWPQVPPALPLGLAFAIVAAAITLVPAWLAHPNWRPAHRYGLMFGPVVGNMVAGYVGYIWATTPVDFWGKTVLDMIAVLALVALGFRLGKASSAAVPA